MNTQFPITIIKSSLPTVESDRKIISSPKVGKLAQPYNVISVLDRTIYTYLKIGCKPTSIKEALSDKTISRQMAIITTFINKTSFNLQWYPAGKNDEIQILENLPAEKWPQVVEDLVAAGFGEIVVEKHFDGMEINRLKLEGGNK